MTLTIELAPDVETRLRAEAERRGQNAAEYVKTIVEERLRDSQPAASGQNPESKCCDAAYLMTLPMEERHRILAAAAEKAAPYYEADLALPVEERKLTAFTALDGDPFYDYDDDDAA